MYYKDRLMREESEDYWVYYYDITYYAQKAIGKDIVKKCIVYIDEIEKKASSYAYDSKLKYIHSVCECIEDEYKKDEGRSFWVGEYQRLELTLTNGKVLSFETCFQRDAELFVDDEVEE